MNNELDWKLVARVILIGVGIWVASFLIAWGAAGATVLAAAKAASLAAGTWLLGHVQPTGYAKPTTDGLRVAQNPPAPGNWLDLLCYPLSWLLTNTLGRFQR